MLRRGGGGWGEEGERGEEVDWKVGKENVMLSLRSSLRSSALTSILCLIAYSVGK